MTQYFLTRYRKQLALAGLLLACTINFYLFKYILGLNYFEFYLKSGVVVAFSILLLELAWKDLEKNDGLVSADPADYIGACLQLIGLPLLVIGYHLDSKTNTNIANTKRILDSIAVMVFAILATSTLFLWLIIITPAQYFVNLFCGAPSRIINSSNALIYARFTDGPKLEWKLLQKKDSNKFDPKDGWWDASMRHKSIKVTNAFVAATLLILNWIWSNYISI